MRGVMRRGLEIMLWSGVMQLFLIAAFTAGWMVHVSVVR